MEKEEKTEQSDEQNQEFKGKNLEDAISHAEHKLKIPRSEMNYEVVTEKTKLFGISKEIVIRAWPKIEAEENAVSNFLEKLRLVFPLEITYEIKKRNGFVFVIFDGNETASALERRCAALGFAAHSQQDFASKSPGRLRVFPKEKGEKTPRVRPGSCPTGLRERKE